MQGTIIKPRYLNDVIAKKLFTTNAGIAYLQKILSLLLNIPLEDIKTSFVSIHPNISSNVNIVDSEADLVFKNDKMFFNIEFNYVLSKESKVKNFSYICQLSLRELKKAKEYSNFIPIRQINFNGYDYYGDNEFISITKLINIKTHKIYSDIIEIYDINLEKLEKLDYTDIMSCNDELMKSCYFFVCEEIKTFKKLYEGDELMEELREEAETLSREEDAILFYNRQKLLDAAAKEAGFNEGRAEGRAEGLAEGIAERNSEIAKNLLILKTVSDKDIINVTGLTAKEINNLKKELFAK